MSELHQNKTIGVLVGGGPAPGLNSVIHAVTIEGINKGFQVWGIMEGFRYLAEGKRNMVPLTIQEVSRIHLRGGSILKTSRVNPTRKEETLRNTVQVLLDAGITHLVTIGGDDTAFGAMEIARTAGGQIKFAHVPKTIDNDLPLPNNLPTFGYQTARDLGATLVKNLMEDARTMDRWYITVAMGRHAGHLALGIAKSAGATLAIIAEEFGHEGFIPLDHICDIVETAVIKRRAMGNRHGVVVIAEGVAERLSPEELKQIPGVIVEYDSFGNIQHSEIELGKIIKLKVESRFAARGEKMSMVEINIGYVLRCADPIPFDQEYTRDLGFQAVRYLLNDNNIYKGNAMISVDNGKLHPIPFEEIIDKETKKTAVRLVDVTSDSYRVARSYMVRLEKRDLEDKELLPRLAAAARMTPKQFIERFEYLAK